MQDGGGKILPIVDNVVDLRFDYFGDPAPPTVAETDRRHGQLPL